MPFFVKEMLRPIPAALASCTRFFEAMSAMRDSFLTLQNLRVGHSSTPMTPNDLSVEGSNYLTPSQRRERSIGSDTMAENWRQLGGKESELGNGEARLGVNQRRLSWPPVQ
ncbi:hypothetical protein HPP92_013591 [Vanilla planifolia]|uniref:Uncharacterized protein n=1 Tax=Vanilla planifolia TaxID=51239 RepID=A0A835QNQ7_VANPL|nr:hypothetical protein HPP92_013591 [Vanilla planifolia]